MYRTVMNCEIWGSSQKCHLSNNTPNIALTNSSIFVQYICVLILVIITVVDKILTLLCDKVCPKCAP